MSRTRLVAFDLDDTLYVEMDFVKSGFRAVAAALSDRTDIDGEDLYRDLCDVLNRDGRGKVFDTVLDRHSLQGTTPGELVSIYRNHEPALELPTDSRKVLVRLRNRGHALAIVTDGDPGVQRAKVRALGLEELVDMAIYTWDEGPEAGKPSPKGFERLLGATGSKPGDLMYVADDPRQRLPCRPSSRRVVDPGTNRSICFPGTIRQIVLAGLRGHAVDGDTGASLRRVRKPAVPSLPVVREAASRSCWHLGYV